MAKKTDDLKVTDEQLKNYKRLIGAMNGATTRVRSNRNSESTLVLIMYLTLHESQDLLKFQAELEEIR